MSLWSLPDYNFNADDAWRHQVETGRRSHLNVPPEIDFSAWRCEQDLPHYVSVRFHATSPGEFRESQEVSEWSSRSSVRRGGRAVGEKINLPDELKVLRQTLKILPFLTHRLNMRVPGSGFPLTAHDTSPLSTIFLLFNTILKHLFIIIVILFCIVWFNFILFYCIYPCVIVNVMILCIYVGWQIIYFNQRLHLFIKEYFFLFLHI